MLLINIMEVGTCRVLYNIYIYIYNIISMLFKLYSKYMNLIYLLHYENYWRQSCELYTSPVVYAMNNHLLNAILYPAAITILCDYIGNHSIMVAIDAVWSILNMC